MKYFTMRLFQVINFRSVRRWKEKFTKLKELPAVKLEPGLNTSTRPKRIIKQKKEYCEDVDTEDQQNQEAETTRKRRGFLLDREKIQYAKELIDNHLTNKEMSELLELSIACVRKLKSKIQDGTAEELIDNTEEHYKKIKKTEDPDGEILILKIANFKIFFFQFLR